MGVITLNVISSEKGTKKTMQFDSSTLVFDVCNVIREKLHMNVDPWYTYGTLVPLPMLGVQSRVDFGKSSLSEYVKE
ncbi:hypothetical protein TELCIR_02277 [Teladorsagia circumcincta]|uniref:Talin N-terminal F0 domain-containing protein n=1 Tax=Teladorsagia circumcincta TaxID=45464 RepID=A0A2G9V120_TELCI|nr:hypothetical protein TELCIR_02277 [Teladorsagia circumcincta]